MDQFGFVGGEGVGVGGADSTRKVFIYARIGGCCVEVSPRCTARECFKVSGSTSLAHQTKS